MIIRGIFTNTKLSPTRMNLDYKKSIEKII